MNDLARRQQNRKPARLPQLLFVSFALACITTYFYVPSQDVLVQVFASWCCSMSLRGAHIGALVDVITVGT